MSLISLLSSQAQEEEKLPKAIPSAQPAYAVVGSVVSLDARASTDPQGSDLTFTWTFERVPIGSVVKVEGFKPKDASNSLVTFSPDIVGDYQVGVIASNGVRVSSKEFVTISVRAILVPHGRGHVPDGKFIWSYIRDAWSHVENREVFESLWSALIQLSGAEALKLYQNDFNKSIDSIQDFYQRRWLAYEPKLVIDSNNCQFILGGHYAGTDGVTNDIWTTPPTGPLTKSIAFPYDASTKVLETTAGRIIVAGGKAYTVKRVNKVSTSYGEVVIVSTNEEDVIANQIGVNWRLPHTLISSTQNFDDLGVVSGDVIYFDVTDTTSGLVSSFKAQVVGVRGNSLGVILTDEAVPGGNIPDVDNEDLVKLSKELAIGMAMFKPDSDFLITSAAKTIVDYIGSIEFRRAYWNKKLNKTSSITVPSVGKTFNISPSYIIRNSKIPIEEDVASIPVLQNWIKQPETVQHDGKIFQIKNGIEYEISHLPMSLIENRDYILDGEFAFTGVMTFESGSNIVLSEIGYFQSRGIKRGDIFRIETPATLADDYYITDIISEDEIKVHKPIPLYVLSDVVSAQVEIERQNSNRFLRFNNKSFTTKLNAPDRFWAEVSMFNNDETIENNFGLLVGLTRDDVATITPKVKYRQAVAGLMYAYTSGSAIDRVRLGAQILLGLPFSEYKGVIKSIEEDYRVDAFGNPIEGRLYVEDIEEDGTPTGLHRIYIYPIEENSRLAGLEVNPETGVEYKVGDTVEIFKPLSKGVEVLDYLMEPTASWASGKKFLQQFHTIKIRANDSALSVEELTLLSSFLKRITPSYITSAIAMTNEVFDNENVSDNKALRIKLGPDYLVDNASINHRHAVMFDQRVTSEIVTALYGDSESASTGSESFSVRLIGNDLSTTYGSATATSLGSKFLTPDFGEAPVIRPEDRLIITHGLNRGVHRISSVAQTTLDLVTPNFQTASAQRFAVVRFAQHSNIGFLSAVTASVASGNPVITTRTGLQSDGVAPGDTVALLNGGYKKRFTVLRVGGPADDGLIPTLASGELVISPTPTFTGASTPIHIYRESLMDSHPSGPTSLFASAEGISGGAQVIPGTFFTMADIGDELVSDSAIKRRFTILDPINGAVTPYIPTAVVESGVIVKKGNQAPAIGWDHLLFLDPDDRASIAIGESTAGAAICTAASSTVVLQEAVGAGPLTTLNPVTYGIIPGDLLVLTSGGNSSVDIGYGNGIYPIISSQAGDVTLSVSLTSNDDSPWKVIRRR